MSKSHLLRGLLKRQFPSLQFDYVRFNQLKFSEKSKTKKNLSLPMHGAIVELKYLKSNGLRKFDQLFKEFSQIPLIFILSPQSFSLFSPARKKLIFEHMMILSEIKSLDYLTQLPRLMEEVSFRHKIRKENDDLRKLIQTERPLDRSLHSALRAPKSKSSQKGLKITLNQWGRVRNRFGTVAQNEILDAFSRMISRAVRASDRVLRNRDNEFIVFLSNVETSQQRQCMQRVKDKLMSIEILENTRKLGLNFSISPVANLPPAS